MAVLPHDATLTSANPATTSADATADRSPLEAEIAEDAR
jgi:hypothetical protein